MRPPQNKDKTSYTVGRLANAAGVGITTVRYYQRRGLLDVPDRPTLGGFRSYGEADLARLQLIRRAQEIGFTLTEIAELIAHLQDANCEGIRALAAQRAQTLQTQVRNLCAMADQLAGLAEVCTAECSSHCPLVQRLAVPAPRAEP